MPRFCLEYLQKERGMSKEEIFQFLTDNMSKEELDALQYDWSFWARANQLMPEDKPYRGYFFCAGKGSGKTHAGAAWVNQRAKAGKGPIALIGATVADVVDVMLHKHTSSIMQISSPEFRPKWEPSKRTVTWPNGVVGTTYSAEDPEQLRGPSHATAWLDEPCKYTNLEEVYTHMNQGLRVSSDPRWLATSTPKPLKLMRKWTSDPKIYVIYGSTFDNANFLPAGFLEDLLDKYEGTTIGEQEIYGKILFEAEHGLWKREIIDRHRVYVPPPLEIVAIGVDPATSSRRASNATGISVAGAAYSQVNARREAYVLEDATCKGPPAKWAMEVKRLMDRYKATTIVAESNQGGEMVRDVLVKYGVPDWRIKLIHAGQSKYDRAQPIAALCEQGRIHHVGTDNLQALEDELVAFEGLRDKRNSPDRMDAYVHVLDELLTSNDNKMVVKHIRI